MNEIVNKFLLAGDKLKPGMHPKQPVFTYSACGSFTKTKERIQKFKETKYIYQNELDKACFQHDMAFADFKELARRTASDNVLRDKALILLKTENVMDMKEELFLQFSNSLIKKTSGSGATTLPNESAQNKQLAENY